MALIYFHQLDDLSFQAAAFSMEEEYWPLDAQVYPANVNNVIIWADDGGFVLTQFDEDFWQNPVIPVAAANAFPQQFVFDAGETQPIIIFSAPDEDFWTNPVKSVPQSFIIPNYALFEDQVPAGHLLAEMDEDFWTNPVAPQSASMFVALPLAFDDNSLIPAATSGSGGTTGGHIYGINLHQKHLQHI